MNVGVAIARNAQHNPDSPAVFEDDRELTYRALDERTSRLANALIDRYDISRSDRVALLVHNRTEVIEVLGGCAKAGATYVGLNFRLKEPEYRDILDNADPRVLITEPEYSELAKRLAGERDLKVLMIDDPGTWGLRGDARRRKCEPTTDTSRNPARRRFRDRLYQRHDRTSEGRALRRARRDAARHCRGPGIRHQARIAVADGTATQLVGEHHVCSVPSDGWCRRLLRHA